MQELAWKHVRTAGSADSALNKRGTAPECNRCPPQSVPASCVGPECITKKTRAGAFKPEKLSHGLSAACGKGSEKFQRAVSHRSSEDASKPKIASEQSTAQHDPISLGGKEGDS